MVDAMIVLSFHGRQNQNIEAAINILSRAVVSSGLCVQSVFFPGNEPTSYVWGLVKIDKNPIVSKQKEQHDFTLMFDPELNLKEAANHAKDSSVVIFNTSQKINTGPFRKRKIKIFALDATGISLSVTGRPHMAMLGALAKNFSKISMKSIKTASEHFREGTAAIEEGYKAVKMVK